MKRSRVRRLDPVACPPDRGLPLESTKSQAMESLAAAQTRDSPSLQAVMGGASAAS